MIDMEQDVEPPITRPTMRELNEYLQNQDYTQFAPQAVMMMFALVRQYDPILKIRCDIVRCNSVSCLMVQGQDQSGTAES